MSASRTARTLWLRIAASTDRQPANNSHSRLCRQPFPQSCSPPSHRARRDATTTTFVDLLYSLASYPHVHSSNVSSQGKHCLSADSEARRRRTLGDRCSSQQRLQPGCMHCLARLPSLPCRNHIILISLPQKSFAPLITQG